MPFDPNVPVHNAELTSALFRGQFNGLKEIIDSMSSITRVVVDAVNTLPPGTAADVSMNVIGSGLHFTFGIPQGFDGAAGQPGEVSQTDLNNAMQNTLGQTSSNSNGVGNLSMNADPSYDQNQMQAVMQKLDELINALRR